MLGKRGEILILIIMAIFVMVLLIPNISAVYVAVGKENITINNLGQTGFEQTNQEYTSSRSVVLKLDYNESSNNKCGYSNNNIDWPPWETCQPFKFWFLSDGNGLKTVYYKVNRTDGSKIVVNDTIYLETEGKYLDVTNPSYPTITDEGDYTNSNNSLYVSWSGANDPELFFTGKLLEYAYKIYDNTSYVNLSNTWTSTGTNIYVNATGLNLTHNHTYSFEIRVNNSADLTNTSMSDGIIVDLVNPTMILSSSHPDDEWTTNNTIYFNWSTSEETLAGFSYVLDKVSNTVPDNILELGGSVKNKTLSVTNDGIYYSHIRAKDLAGNFGPTIHYGFIGIDTTVPNRPVITNPQRFANTTNLSFIWTTYDATSGVVNVSLNVTEVNGSTIFFEWLGNVTNYKVTNATVNKSYFATVTAKDKVNLTRKSQSILDMNAPVIFFSKPNGNIRNKPILVLKTDEQAVCNFNGSEFSYTNSTYHETKINLQDGSYQLSVRCVDIVGYATIKDLSFSLITGQSVSSLSLNIPNNLFVYSKINITLESGIGEIRKNEIGVYLNNKLFEDYSLVDIGNGNYSLLFEVESPNTYIVNVSIDSLMTSSSFNVNDLLLVINYSESLSTKNLSRLTYAETNSYSIGIASESRKANVKSTSSLLKLESEFDGNSYIFATKTGRYLYQKKALLEEKNFDELMQAFGYRNKKEKEYKILLEQDSIIIQDAGPFTGRQNLMIRNMGLNNNNQTVLNISLKNE